MKFLRYLSTSNLTFYDILELPKTCTVTDIKKQFKILSKQYHPDLNNHLKDDEKQDNADKFIRIVNAYETLKDKKKRQEYDRTLQGGFNGSGQGSGRAETFNYSYNNSQRDWQNQYYGESKYYSASRLNRTRSRVKHTDFDDVDTKFTGKHMNYGDRFDVPHFNYQEHLSKHLKFEQRMINRQLSPEEREAILKQLTKTYDISELDEELVTKHLKRQINRTDKAAAPKTININQSNPFIYQKPSYDDESSGFKTMMILGGASGGLLVMYKMIFGS